MNKMNKRKGWSRLKGWRNTDAYKAIVEMMNDYWLNDPDESYVEVNFAFVHKDGQCRTGTVYWDNPNPEGTSPDAKKRRTSVRSRRFEMPAGLGEWTAEEKKMFTVALAEMKSQFYRDITHKILAERRKRNVER